MIYLWKRACILVMLLFIQTINAQTEPGSTLVKKEKFRPGISFGSGCNFFFANGGDLDDVNFFVKPAVTLQKSKHLLSLGGTFGAYGKNYATTRQWGVEFMYQYYPNGSDKTFNLYFLVDPAVSFYRQTHNNYSYGYSYYGYNYYSYTNSVFLLKMAAGYGVRANLAKWCYFYEHNEIGVARGENTTTYSYQGYHPSTTIDAYGFVQLSFGLGFVF